MNRFTAYAIVGITLLLLFGAQVGIVWQMVFFIYIIYTTFHLLLKHHLPKNFLTTVAILFIGPVFLQILIHSFHKTFLSNNKSLISLLVLLVVFVVIGRVYWNRKLHNNKSSQKKPNAGERKFLTPFIGEKFNQQSNEGDID